MTSLLPLDIRPDKQKSLELEIPEDVLQQYRSSRPIPIPPRRPEFIRGKGNGGKEGDAIGDLLSRLTTSLDGKPCAKVANENEMPILRAGKKTNGCHFASAKTDPITYDIYKKHKDQIVLVDAKGESGSRKGGGVMVGSDASHCFVLSDFHVTNGMKPDKTVSSLRATLADGAQYDATIQNPDPSVDLSLIRVNTGADTAKVCKPVKVAEDLSAIEPGKTTVSLSYPYFSTSVYAASGLSQGVTPLISTFGYKTSDPEHPWVSTFNEVVPGEDTGRNIIVQDAQQRVGSSGGATFNLNDELTGLVNRVRGITETFSTPVTRSVVDRLMKNR